MKQNRRTQRQKSNIFEMLTTQQISELRDAFNLFDTNTDSYVTRQDLETILPSIGSPFTAEEIDKMVKESGNMNFLAFITMIGERLSLIDDKNVIMKAFGEFKEGGKVKADVLKHWLMNEGDKMSESEVDTFLKGWSENGQVNVEGLVSIIKHGEMITPENVK